MNFVKNRKIVFLISALIILAGVISFIFQGFNWDIDFIGGKEMTYDIGVSATREVQEKIEAAIENELGVEVSTIMNAGDTEIVIRTKSITDEEEAKISEYIKTNYKNENVENVVVSTREISESVGGELRREAIIATLVAIALMLVYIAIRFEIRSGLTAIIGLCHDVLIMLTAYTIFRIPINTSFIAAILTIIGYSINAAIIVLDRVRANKKLLAAGNEEVVNISIKQCLTRTVNTTITTLFTIGMVCILGVTSIREFTIPLIVGIVSGLYSSIFLTGPVWELLSKKVKKKK